MSNEDKRAGEVKKPKEVLGLALVAGDRAAEEVEPGKETLHLPAPLVAPQLTSILRRRAFAATTVWRNELHATLVPESLVEFVAVVGLVSDEPFGEFINEAVVERGLDDFDLVG